jgi:hypothetical protein
VLRAAQRGSYPAAASLRIDSEGLDIAFQQRFAIAHDGGPALLGADHLDLVMSALRVELFFEPPYL